MDIARQQVGLSAAVTAIAIATAIAATITATATANAIHIKRILFQHIYVSYTHANKINFIPTTKTKTYTLVSIILKINLDDKTTI